MEEGRKIYTVDGIEGQVHIEFYNGRTYLSNPGIGQTAHNVARKYKNGGILRLKDLKEKEIEIMVRSVKQIQFWSPNASKWEIFTD